MANARYLARIAGVLQMVAANSTSAGAGDAGKIPCLDSTGKLDSTMMPSGLGPDSVSAVASAAIAANTLVNLYNNAGTLTARPADNSVAGQEANAYSTAAVSNAGTGTFNCASGIVSGGFSGLTIGGVVYLGTVGLATMTAPSAAGNIIQVVGKALSASSIQFNPQEPTTVA